MTEQYAYDADGRRVTRQRQGVTTVYAGGGLWEEEWGRVWRYLYTLGGRPIAQRDSGGAVIYLHGDHLGSASAVTGADGRVLARQQYDPWGKVRAGDLPQTTLDYTGQRKDETGLLYYNARYYDPAVGRFLSADSIVPGMAGSTGGAAATLGHDERTALTPLTVDFHEPQFAQAVGREARFTLGKGFRFQLGQEDRAEAKWQWGPQNPQALNRYAYVLNNPVRYTDPTGHIISWRVFLQTLRDFFFDELCPICKAWLAYQAFQNGHPIELIGELGAFTLDPGRLYGSNLHDVRQIESGRLKGYGRGNTERSGGLEDAKDLFRRLTGRDPEGEFDRAVLDEIEVVFRADSRSGIPKIEIVDHVTQFLEKISFVP